MPASVGAVCAASNRQSRSRKKTLRELGLSDPPELRKQDSTVSQGSRLSNDSEPARQTSSGTQREHSMQSEERMDHLKQAIQSSSVADFDASPNKGHHFILNSIWLNVAVNLLTLLNTAQMGFEADYPEMDHVWTICENVFTAGFLMEALLKLYILRLKYFKELANCLDFSLVVLGIIDCWILSQLTSGGADLQAFSILRILRLARLARILKLVRAFKPLVLVIQGITATMSTLCYVFALLVLIFYVFAIFFKTNLGVEPNEVMYPGYSTNIEIIDSQEVMMNYNPNVYFGSMWLSMITLFNMATFNEWQEVLRPIALKQPIYVPVFVLYALFVAFGVMNVMTGLIVDSVIAEAKCLDEAHTEAVMKARLKTLERVQGILSDMDLDGDGTIDHEEMCFAMKSNPQFNKLLKSINLPSAWTAEELLDMLDNNGDGVLQEAEFTTSFFRLLESDQFQQVCILQASINQVKRMIQLGHDEVQTKHAAMAADISSMKTAMGLATQSQAPLDRSDNNGELDRGESRQSMTSNNLLERAHHHEQNIQAKHDECTLRLDNACNDLKEKVEQLSHAQLIESLDVAYAAMKDSFNREIVSMKAKITEHVSNLGDANETRDQVFCGDSLSRPAGGGAETLKRMSASSQMPMKMRDAEGSSLLATEAADSLHAFSEQPRHGDAAGSTCAARSVQSGSLNIAADPSNASDHGSVSSTAMGVPPVSDLLRL